MDETETPTSPLEHLFIAQELRRRNVRPISLAPRFIGEFEKTLVLEAKRHATDGVICGHLHQPALKQVDGLCYANAGDWVENCTALVEHLDGRLAIVNWITDWPDIALQMIGDEDLLETELLEQPVTG